MKKSVPVYDHLPIDERLLGDFLSLTPAERNSLRERIHRMSLRRGLTYQKRAGVTEAMNLIPLPVVLPISQISYLARLCWEIINIVKGLMPLYLNTPSLREILPLLPREEQWVKECWHPSHHIRQPIIYRLDADMPLASPDAALSARFFESNSVAVGGMLYAPVAESIIAGTTLRALYGKRGEQHLQPNQDMRTIVLKKLTSHARSIGRKGTAIAIVEDKSWDTGITECPSLVRYFRRLGLKAYLVDPRELAFKGDELRYRGRVIDVVYRNFELRDLLELEDEGEDLSALKAAFRRNQVVSSMSGEFDHKSLWEVLSSGQFARLFNSRQRKLLSLHIPWTRLIFERITTDAGGRRIDLTSFISKHRTRLVVKPNRHCGGEGVSIGLEKTQSEWDRGVENAFKNPREWVVQEYISNKMKRLPYFYGEKGFRVVPMYTTYGFISTPHGFGMVGRACKRRIVNVRRGGALLSVFKLAG